MHIIAEGWWDIRIHEHEPYDPGVGMAVQNRVVGSRAQPDQDHTRRRVVPRQPIYRLLDFGHARVHWRETIITGVAVANAREIEAQHRVAERREGARHGYEHPVMTDPVNDPGVEDDEGRTDRRRRRRRLGDNTNQGRSGAKQDRLFADFLVHPSQSTIRWSTATGTAPIVSGFSIQGQTALMNSVVSGRSGLPSQGPGGGAWASGSVIKVSPRAPGGVSGGARA